MSNKYSPEESREVIRVMELVDKIRNTCAGYKDCEFISAFLYLIELSAPIQEDPYGTMTELIGELEDIRYNLLKD